ncbi:MAG: LacI family DNA-binding transcriptional regulator [Pseudomonadota bacterium]
MTESPRRPPSPTLQDVATAAGVSTATVSRCLNAPDRVVEKTRQKVLRVVREMGYAPNFGAQALAAKRTNTIGAIIPTMENAIFARGLQAFQEELARHGLTLLVASSSYKPDLEEEQIRTLIARGADALLLIGFDRAQGVYDYLAKRGIPYVVSWAHRGGDRPLAVGFDNRAAMQMLADRVFALGHEAVAVITAPVAENDRARERVEAVCDAATAVGQDATAIPIYEVPYSIENGARAMKDLMARTPRPTAVLCGNDVLAVGALSGARALGLAVPRDVSITGFDDIELAQIAEPALTTVHVPHATMGREAASLIAKLLAGATGQSVALETQIVMRNSLAPPKAL